MQTSAYEVKGCYANFDSSALVIGNNRIERRWDMSQGMPVSVSLLNKTDGVEWLDAGEARRKRVCGIPVWDISQPAAAIEVDFGVDDDFGIGAEHLKVTVRYSWSELQLKLELLIYPDTAWIRQRLYVCRGLRAEGLEKHTGTVEAAGQSGLVHGSGTQTFGMDDNAKETAGGAKPEDYIEALPLNELHARWQSVELRDVTDTNNNLISIDQGLLYTNEKRKLKGNVMLLQQTLQPTGLMVIKEGPTAHGHLNYPGGDFEFDRRLLLVTGTGLAPSDVCDEWVPAYGSAVGVWTGGEYESLQVLNALHRSIRAYKPERDFFLMCNNWGDRSKDGRVSETFVIAELERAEELGVTNVQIDDGWQHGNTTNSVNPAGGRWSNYYADGDGFWNIHPERFPNGFGPLLETVTRTGRRLALWFSPDSANDFANWHKDADRLLQLHREYGVCYFKLDGIKIRSKYGEMNLLRMMQTVIGDTNGQVYFNLDATNEIRLGFYGQTQYGGLFLENRYTDFRSYYPHWTLRNLWQLAKYVPTQKLQMEFLNVERNRHVYGEDPLAPSRSGIAYAFAVTMFTNPLVWMELTGLSETSREVLKQAFQVYNRHQRSILSGHVLPIGSAPDGASWTGFQSIIGEGEGYLLVIRELNPHSGEELRLWDAERFGINSSLELTPVLRMEDRDRLIEGSEPDERLTVLKPALPTQTYRFELRNPFNFALYQYKHRRDDEAK